MEEVLYALVGGEECAGCSDAMSNASGIHGGKVCVICTHTKE